MSTSIYNDFQRDTNILSISLYRPAFLSPAACAPYLIVLIRHFIFDIPGG
jgi:hypothetical protein